MATTSRSTNSFTPASRITVTAGARVLRPALFDPAPAVVAALAAGLEADLDDWAGATPDTSDAASWGAERTLDAVFIVKLCTDTNAQPNPYPRGIRIKGARIVGNLDLSTATIGGLLLLERCRVEGNVSLRDSTTKLLNFAGSRVCGSIDADRLRTGGGVYLRDGFRCEKAVRLSAASINGDLDCRRGTIDGAADAAGPPGSRLALRCDRAAITGSVFFVHFEARGEVRLLDATIGANVVCDDSAFENAHGHALLADNAKIGGSFVFGPWKRRPRALISVRNATARALNLGNSTHTDLGANNIQAQGFRYETIAGDGAVNLAMCMRWLDALVVQPFNPQPYEQCARVLRDLGLAGQAKDVAILRRRVERRLPGVTPLQRLRGVLLDVLVGYGYRPGRSVFILFLLTVLGMGVFRAAASSRAMVPSETAVAASFLKMDSLPAGYPRLNALVYSLDVLLPIIDFQQDSKWRPDQTATTTVGGSVIAIGSIAIWTMRALIAAGWILSTLLAASVTGLIRKD